MTSQYGLHLKTFVLILIMVSVAPLGNTYLGKGMEHIPPRASWAPSDVFHFFFRAFTSATIWLGIGLLLTYFVAYLLVLSWADYSYVLPASSIAVFVTTLLGHLILHEDVRPIRWAGVSLICLGVFFVGYTHPSTTGRDS